MIESFVGLGKGRFPGGDYSVVLDNDLCEFQAAAGEWKIRSGDATEDSLAPAGSGGLLLALSLWRRLAVEGTGNFGEVVYFGTAPLPGTDALKADRLVDVLRATAGGADCWFYFEPKSGELVAMEMFPAQNVDPCELHFGGYKKTDAGWMPSTIKLRFGNEIEADFSVDEVELQPSKKEEAASTK